MEDLIDFLRRRGLCEDALQLIREQKIDVDVLPLMPDEELQCYIPLYGDRLAAVNFCKCKRSSDYSDDPGCSDDPGSAISQSIGRLKSKLSKGKRPLALGDGDHYKNNANRDKPTRRVELGWTNFDSQTNEYKQVRIQNGGGVRHLHVPKNSGKKDLLELGMSLFFPGGVSRKGKLDEFCFELKDFEMKEWGTRTVQEIYQQTKVKMLRAYLCTKTIDEVDEGTLEDTAKTDSSSSEWEPQPMLTSSCAPAVTPQPTPHEDDVIIEENQDSFIQLLPETEMYTGDTQENNTLPDLTAPEEDGSVIQISELENDSDVSYTNSGTPTIQFNLRPRLRPRLRLKKQEQVEKKSESLRDVLVRLERNVKATSKNIINVDRNNVLDGGFRGFSRPTFDPWQKLSVRFVDEDGIDEGGPMREFLRLGIKAVQHLSIFSGGDERKMLILDYNGLNKNLYLSAGKFISYCIVHRGPIPCFFSPLLFTMLASGVKNANPEIDDISDYELRSQVEEIRDSKTPENFRLAVEKVSEMIALSGCINLSLFHTEENQRRLVQALTRFITVDRLIPAFEQFKEGLQTMNLVDEIRANIEAWREVFVASCNTPLDPIQVEETFVVQWSEEGSNYRREEQRILSYWRDLLQDLSDGAIGPISERQLGLSDVLVFVTGAETIPHMGFDPQPQLSFLHPQEETESQHLTGMPRSNTCSMHLKLPVVKDFDTFKSNMLAAFEMVTTFTTQ